MENQLIISLKPYLSDYLRHITASPSGVIKITRRNMVGRLIYSLVRKSEVPVQATGSDVENIVVVLPDVRFANLQRKFLYLPKEAEQTVKDFIESHFDITFYKFMSMASDMKIMQKDAINLFLRGYNFRENSLTFDALKKKEYRKRRKIEDFLVELVQRSDF